MLLDSFENFDIINGLQLKNIQECLASTVHMVFLYLDDELQIFETNKYFYRRVFERFYGRPPINNNKTKWSAFEASGASELQSKPPLLVYNVHRQQ